MRNKNLNLAVFILIVIAAIASRFIPHPFNFTAVGAVALFSGAVMSDKRFAYLVPLIILFISDLILKFHFSMVPVYGCFAITVWIGSMLKQTRWYSIAGASLISSVIFFLITNLPFWYLDLQLYPMTISGTLESYKMALPFFRNQVLGDLFFNALLFGIYFLIPADKKLQPVALKK